MTVCTGGAARTRCWGGDGNDELMGGAGRDITNGGLSVDSHGFVGVADSNAATGRDRIADLKRFAFILNQNSPQEPGDF